MRFRLTVAGARITDPAGDAAAPVIAPFACNSIAVKNALSVPIKIRTDEAEDELAAGSQEAITAHYSGAVAQPLSSMPDSAYRRFKAGATVMFLKATEGSGTVKVRFLF